MFFLEPAKIKYELSNLNNERKKPNEHEDFHVYNETAISNHNSSESLPKSEESDLSELGQSVTQMVGV